MNRQPAVDIIVASPLWDGLPRVKPVLRRAVRAAASPTAIPESELSIVLTDDAAIKELNRRWRGRDEPTNVLSFPAPAVTSGAGEPRHLGDVVIAYETATREAIAQGLPIDHHLAHLAVHGLLHLLGYDHESDGEAETMEQLERDILATLDVPDPYAGRDEADRP
jgi:probable rRNA maturation factor